MEKTLTTVILITLALAGSQAAIAHPGHEESSSGNFTIYPSYTHKGNSNWIILDAEQGAEIKDFITVENLSHEEQTLKLEIKGAEVSGDSYMVKDNDPQNEIIKWSQLGQSTITLQSHESIKIPFELTVPKNANIQKYTGAILASQENINSDSVDIVKRIGVRMFVNVVEPQPVQTNIISSPAFTSGAFFFLSLFGVLASLFYTLINYLDQRKYEKKHA